MVGDLFFLIFRYSRESLPAAIVGDFYMAKIALIRPQIHSQHKKSSSEMVIVVGGPQKKCKCDISDSLTIGLPF